MANPFITQANPMMGQTLIDPESLALQRQKQFAAALLQQNQQPQGQMVSGRYVAPSITQQLNATLNPLLGASILNKADTKQAEVTGRQQLLAQQNIADALRLSKGGEETVYGAGMEGPTKEVTQIAPDSNAAIAKLLRPNATAIETGLGAKLLERQFREPKYQEVNILNKQTGDTETYRYDANSPNPTSTMQLLGTNKPALTRADEIKFRDEGINTNFGGTNAPVMPNQNALNSQVTPQVKPASSVDATQGYNPFKAPPVPAGLTGKQARDWRADQAKPLTGDDAKQVSGAINYQKSLNSLQDLFQKYKGPELLNPNVRAEIQQSLNNALLQGKEANRLGVLNGPDLTILEKIVGDPTAVNALIKDRSTFNKLYDNQRMFTTEVIKTNYRSAQKPVPENLREFVEIKPRELKTDIKPSASTATQRAVMPDGQNIVVKNGRWVYERTGKAVE